MLHVNRSASWIWKPGVAGGVGAEGVGDGLAAGIGAASGAGCEPALAVAGASLTAAGAGLLGAEVGLGPPFAAACAATFGAGFVPFAGGGAAALAFGAAALGVASAIVLVFAATGVVDFFMNSPYRLEGVGRLVPHFTRSTKS